MTLTFTYKETIDLVKAFVSVTLIFWWVASPSGPINYSLLPIIALFVGLAFILHELAHKAMATYYGYRSEFHSFDKMIFVSLLLGFIGFIFLAPGAVMVDGVRKLKHLGIISIVGPMTNVILALICLLLAQWLPIANFGFQINAWLAFFNMIPLWGLDGAKVLAWNKVVFAVSALVVVVIYIYTYL
jgi:Zn-dependent protease